MLILMLTYVFSSNINYFVKFQIHEQTFALSNDADFENECSMSNDGDSPENIEVKTEVRR